MTLTTRLFNFYNLKQAGRIISPVTFEHPFQRGLKEISKRYTIGKNCKKPCKRPRTCKELSRVNALQASSPKVPCKVKKAVDCKVPKSPPCPEDGCLPFRYFPPKEMPPCSPKPKNCRATMRHPCEEPPSKPECFLAKGKMRFTTNERTKKAVPVCPAGNWNYTDEST